MKKIKDFNSFINESLLLSDDLKTLTPDQLGELLIDEVCKESPDLQYIKNILDVGCSVEFTMYNGLTALHYAAGYGHLDAVKFLISIGADINAKDDKGWTALHWAAGKDHTEIVKYLMSNEADIYATNNDDKRAWNVATEEIREACPELNKIEYVDDLETLTPDKLGERLITEVSKDSPDIQHIQNLLDVGCPIDAKNNYGYTALHHAAGRGNLDIVKFLLSKGADIHAKANNGWTVLHSPASGGKLDVIEFLVSMGIELDEVDDQGNTALYYTIDSGSGSNTSPDHLKTAKFLVSIGADVNIRNNRGRTVWDNADNTFKKTIPALKPRK